MKFFRPMVIDDTALTSSSAPEETSNLYLGETIYLVGDKVRLESGTTHTIYLSLQDANTGNDPASSSEWWQNIGETHPTYSGSVAYSVGEVVIDLATHHEWESLQDGNLANDPILPTSSTWWFDRGYNNRWTMFDASITSQTVQPEEMTVAIRTVGRNDSIALLNIECSALRIVAEDDVDGVVYDSGIISMTAGSGVTDWWKFFFEPIAFLTEYALVGAAGMPPYANVSITVTMVMPGGTVKCGALVIGLKKELGATQYGAQFGIHDYSVKTRDQFGNVSVVERGFNKFFDVQVWAENSQINEIQRTMIQFKTVPVVWVGSEPYSALLIYGFYEKFVGVIEYPAISIFNLRIEGLT